MKLIAEIDGERFAVETLRLEPEDVLVFSTLNGKIPQSAVEMIRERAAELFPGHKIVVMQDIKLTVTKR